MEYQITDFVQIKELTANGRKFGKTYLVEHRSTKVKGVLKLIPKEKISDEMLRQLKQEARLSFEEKGLPEIWCQFENENYFSFVKKYQEGIPWEDYVEKLSKKEFHQHLPFAVVQILEILHCVHQKGEIHGDIKPSNLLIQASSPTQFQMEIIDFGMSFTMNVAPDFKFPFALGFAAPEIILNKRELANETTDFFSLAVSVLFLFSGEIPLQHPHPEMFIHLQLAHPIFKPHSVPTSVWEILKTMVVKPIFSKPPNQLSEIEEENQLKIAIGERPPYSEIRERWQQLKVKRTLFGYR